MDTTSFVTPDAAGLKALSHPVRLRILGLLRTEGPATATTLARLLGLNTGATSYHLRQLAQHGFIEDDSDRGNARDRWWRAAHRSTHTEVSTATTPEDHDTLDGYLQAVAITYSGQLQRAVEERRTLPAAWTRAGTMSDWQLRLTPEHAAELTERLVQVIEECVEDDADAEGAQAFTVNLNAYLLPGTLASADTDDAS